MKENKNRSEPKPLRISEDWLAVLLAFALILLSAIGVLGEGGIPIQF